MGQEYKINDCGEIIKQKNTKISRLAIKLVVGCFLVICAVATYPFIVGLIQYGAVRYNPVSFTGLIWVYKNEKVGCIDFLGREVFPIVYDDARFYGSEEINVMINGRWGILNMRGELLIPLIYEEQLNFFYHHSHSSVKLNGKWGVIDRNGNEIIPIIYDGGEIVYGEELFICEYNGYWGAVDFQNKTVIPFVYQNFIQFSHMTGFATVKRKNKYGIINKKGVVIVPFEYDHLDYCYGPGQLLSAHKNGHYGFIDQLGNIIAPFIYDNVRSYCGSWAPVQKNGKWGFIDRKGNLIIDYIYDDLFVYDSYSATVCLNKKQIEISNPCKH